MKTLAGSSVDRMFRALSDRTRLRILNLLLGGELCVCDIVSTLRIAQPTASRHLAYLRSAGLIEARRDGLWMYYRLVPAQSKFHKRLLDCIGCCSGELPQLVKDAKQLGRGRGCCG
jgi:ArsR family transcriptional regulator